MFKKRIYIKVERTRLGHRILKEIKVNFEEYCKINDLNPRDIIEKLLQDFIKKAP